MAEDTVYFPEVDAFLEWAEDLTRFKSRNTIMGRGIAKETEEGKLTYRNIFYTENFAYIFTITQREDKAAFFACGATARKPYAGEDWHRGRDICDGDFKRETWAEMKDNILAFELIQLSDHIQNQINGVPEETLTEEPKDDVTT